MIGATEYGWFHCVEGGNENWDALKFFTGVGYHFDEVSDGIYELVIVKDPDTVKFHGIFETFPGLQEYRTRDLYSQTTPGSGWWQYKGRADDIIILSNGEKINPIPLENLIQTHPKITAALVVGEYQFSPSLLIELASDYTPTTAEGKRQILEEVWPVVQEANKIAPAFSKIPKSLILIAPAGKPFRRAGKGTVQRQNTVKSFSQELEDLFSLQETRLLIEGLSLETPISPNIVKNFTKEIYQQTLEMKDSKSVSSIEDSENVFEKGLDSLGVVVIAQRLKAALTTCGSDIDLSAINSRFIYSAPTINQISDEIIALLEKRNGHSNRDGKSLRQRRLEELLKKYSKDIPSDHLKVQSPNSLENGTLSRERPWKVVLTGTTGSLGSHLLAALDALPESQVEKVYCLNRSENGRERQKKTSLSRGLNNSWSDSRVKFFHVNLSQAQLGLAPDKYRQLIEEASVIIHCAWKVDFNVTVETFEPQIRGVRNLLDLSFHSNNKAPMVFVSSISTALGWLAKTPGSTVPEAIIRNFEAPEQLGYGESKYVSELLIEDFAKRSGITAAVYRTGQIAGPTSNRGCWNKQEWFPSIIASSKHMNVLPETLANFENIDWVPVDTLSTIMVELVGQLISKENRAGETLVYNLVNPKVTSWSSSLLPATKTLTSISRTLPLGDWVDELEKSVRDNHGIITDHNPAAKLLDFFRLLSNQTEVTTSSAQPFELARLLQDSKYASKLEAVSAEWMNIWMDQWKF
jgi:thioester reductase-like protein